MNGGFGSPPAFTALSRSDGIGQALKEKQIETKKLPVGTIFGKQYS
jgi:hypothetical protein